MCHAFNALEALQGLEKDTPGSRLAGAAGTHHHQTVVQIADLVQLEDLEKTTCNNQSFALATLRSKIQVKLIVNVKSILF